MLSFICYFILNKRVKWGDPIEKPFDKWLYDHIK